MGDIRRWIMLCEAENQPILYHGSDDRFDAHSAQGTTYLGIYYSSDKDYARTYGKYLKATHVILHHPFLINRKLTPETIETIKSHGYDGIMAEYQGNPYFEVVAFEPSQVHELSSLKYESQ